MIPYSTHKKDDGLPELVERSISDELFKIIYFEFIKMHVKYDTV